MDGNRLFLLGSSLQTSLTSGEVVRTDSLGTGSEHDVHVASVVLLSLLQHQIHTIYSHIIKSYLSTTNVGLGLLLSLDLGGLVSHLSGTSQRTVHLTSSTQTEDQVEGGLLLDVVIRKSASVLQLLSSEDQTLLIWGNSLLVLNLSLNVFDGIRGLDVQSNGLS